MTVVVVESCRAPHRVAKRVAKWCFEEWRSLGRDLIGRRGGAPVLIVADGAARLTMAIEQMLGGG